MPVKEEVEFGCQPVIQAPKLEPGIMRYELADYEWAAIKPFLPNKPRAFADALTDLEHRQNEAARR
jgi:hypothetical protein